MRPLKLILLALLIVSSRSAFSQNAVYPLAVGTKWGWYAYNPANPVIQSITADTLMPNGHIYAKFSALPFLGIAERFERQDSGRVYEYLPSSQHEMLLFDFSRAAGDTINRDNHTVLLSIDTLELFGAFRRTWVFLIDPIPEAIDDETSWVVTDSLGKTDYFLANGGGSVSGVQVGSRVYGNITSVSQRDTRPKEIAILSNYPNPFNGRTMIEFNTTHQAYVSLRIYNSLGSLVTTLTQSVFQAGRHSIPWDGTHYSSGLYFVRLSTNSGTTAKKIVLVR